MSKRRDLVGTVLAVGISVVWATVAIASMFVDKYAALTVITPVMLIASGFIFGVKITKNGDQ